METTKKINVAGAIRALNPGAKYEFPRGEYIPSGIRTTASIIKADTGRDFTVNLTDKYTIVTRIS